MDLQDAVMRCGSFRPGMNPILAVADNSQGRGPSLRALGDHAAFLRQAHVGRRRIALPIITNIWNKLCPRMQLCFTSSCMESPAPAAMQGPKSPSGQGRHAARRRSSWLEDGWADRGAGFPSRGSRGRGNVRLRRVRPRLRAARVPLPCRPPRGSCRRRQATRAVRSRATRPGVRRARGRPGPWRPRGAACAAPPRRSVSH